jgi:hypothetical protein
MELFSKEMSALSPEVIGERLTFYKEQLQLFHWQTSSYSEHKALCELIGEINTLRDDIIEKIMGYSGKRIRSYKLSLFEDYQGGCCISTANEILNFATQLKKYAESNKMHDIDNLADTLSGAAAKAKYLFTLK